ncbi:thioredoxin reductase 1-related [Anaeramoeba flamelloides]|uniref:Thioredoxin reductase n=1 Tax=Anaeramoeba flamelloides TaxID=1746091 RepID=A0AAV7ZT75_9EUKA|nr:thioredoxin reductase 1-related [Anaeramoeba flamelloides]
MSKTYNIEEFDFTNAKKRNVIVIGSGPAGLTAGIYAARAGLEPLLIRGNEPGGQLVTTTDVENYPGWKGSGPELMMKMEEQCQEQGCELIYGTVKAVDFSKRPFKILAYPDKTFLADSVIIATGASARWLGLESEKKLQNKGISGCATCDGPMYRGENVCVVGGGDVALEDAMFLARFCPKVHLIHRRDKLRGSIAMQKKAMQKKNIVWEWNSVVEEFLGEEELEGVKVKDVKTGEFRTLDVKGAFLAIGHTPNTQMFKGQLDLNDHNYIIVKPNTTYTSVEGVFACGDVMDWVYRQAATSVGSGCKAAIDCERWLADQEN